MSETELVEEFKCQGVIAAKRFTGLVDGKKQNLPTVVLTIEGTTIPEVIKVGPLRIKTRVYKYGHTKNRCKAAARCRNCSKVHDFDEECKNKPYCLNCKGEHGPSSRKCPVYLAEKEITRIRVTKRIDYKEAVKQFNAGAGSYAEVSKVQQRLKINDNNAVADLIKQKDDMIQKLMDTVANLTSRIKELEQTKKDKKQKKQQKKKIVIEGTDQDIEDEMDTDSSLQTAETVKVSDTSSKVNLLPVSNSKTAHKRHPTTEIIPPLVKKSSEQMTVEVDSSSNPDYLFSTD
ncbi:uncharacterized protein LOC129729324 [Wyeomyia smithii]|uniref:uncharacterized protein LOC129729324 n=1 Tax=Wyeomyia smithii TaxID=174621 RepID=UPI0024680D1B|nr:uncharacterized protein LOC129729324 [Wyeomyia smithii]